MKIKSNKKNIFIKIYGVFIILLLFMMARGFLCNFINISWSNHIENRLKNQKIAKKELTNYSLSEKGVYFSFDIDPNRIKTTLNATLKDGKKLTIEVYSDNYGMLLKKIVKIDGKIVSQKKYPPASKWEQLKMRWRSITIYFSWQNAKLFMNQILRKMLEENKKKQTLEEIPNEAGLIIPINNGICGKTIIILKIILMFQQDLILIHASIS